MQNLRYVIWKFNIFCSSYKEYDPISGPLGVIDDSCYSYSSAPPDRYIIKYGTNHSNIKTHLQI